MRITNNSQASQGLNALSGQVYLPPGATADLELSESELAHIKTLTFLGIEGVARDFRNAPNGDAPKTGLEHLDHDGDGHPGGAKPNDPPSERDDLKAQAAELGIEFHRNIPTDKLKALVDAKLAE